MSARSRLITAAKEFLRIKPWTSFQDGHVFGVQIPGNETIYYVSVLGNAEIDLGLNAFPGAEGFWSYQTIASPMFDRIDPIQHLTHLGHFSLSISEREALDDEDKKLLEGFAFRKYWPQFRRYEPYMVPRQLTPDEMIVFAQVIEQTLSVYEEFKSDPDTFMDQYPERVMVRVASETEAGEGHNEFMNAPEKPAPRAMPVAVEDIDDLSRQRLKNKTLDRDAWWEIETMMMPVPVNDKAGPYYPVLPVVVRGPRGTIERVELVDPRNGPERGTAGAIVSLCVAAENLPSRVVFTDPVLAESLEPLFAHIGITVEQEDTLPLVGEAMDNLSRHLRGPGLADDNDDEYPDEDDFDAEEDLDYDFDDEDLEWEEPTEEELADLRERTATACRNLEKALEGIPSRARSSIEIHGYLTGMYCALDDFDPKRVVAGPLLDPEVLEDLAKKKFNKYADALGGMIRCVGEAFDLGMVEPYLGGVNETTATAARPWILGFRDALEEFRPSFLESDGNTEKINPVLFLLYLADPEWFAKRYSEELTQFVASDGENSLKFIPAIVYLLYNQTATEKYENEPLLAPSRKEPGRNEPCPCGSGKKYKKCCMEK